MLNLDKTIFTQIKIKDNNDKSINIKIKENSE